MAALWAALVLKLRLAAALAVCQSERLPVGYRRLKSSNDVLMPHLKAGAVGVATGAGVKFDVDISITLFIVLFRRAVVQLTQLPFVFSIMVLYQIIRYNTVS